MEWVFLGGLGVLVLLAAGAGFLAFRDIAGQQARLRYVHEHGEPVFAAIVDELRERSLHPGYMPVVALLTFDRNAPDPFATLADAARRMVDLKYRAPVAPDEFAVARIIRNPDSHGRYPRVPLPPSFTGGVSVVCVRFTAYQRLLSRPGPLPPFVRVLAARDRADTPIEMIETPV
jgi:hypothetical protein